MVYKIVKIFVTVVSNSLAVLYELELTYVCLLLRLRLGAFSLIV